MGGDDSLRTELRVKRPGSEVELSRKSCSIELSGGNAPNQKGELIPKSRRGAKTRIHGQQAQTLYRKHSRARALSNQDHGEVAEKRSGMKYWVVTRCDWILLTPSHAF